MGFSGRIRPKWAILGKKDDSQNDHNAEQEKRRTMEAKVETWLGGWIRESDFEQARIPKLGKAEGINTKNGYPRGARHSSLLENAC